PEGVVNFSPPLKHWAIMGGDRRKALRPYGNYTANRPSLRGWGLGFQTPICFEAILKAFKRMGGRHYGSSEPP
ncbi:MAG TPA: hypothetical protein PLD47_18065, partial [Aggregatilineales bacterium]|nr:hypothetical protein [Aggregatilineales bacterium]